VYIAPVSLCLVYDARPLDRSAHTSVRGTRGGPDAISTAFVPGRILRFAPASNGFRPSSPRSLGMAMGDLGPS
jgi:hypothetical protein